MGKGEATRATCQGRSTSFPGWHNGIVFLDNSLGSAHSQLQLLARGGWGGTELPVVGLRVRQAPTSPEKAASTVLLKPSTPGYCQESSHQTQTCLESLVQYLRGTLEMPGESP